MMNENQNQNKPQQLSLSNQNRYMIPGLNVKEIGELTLKLMIEQTKKTISQLGRNKDLSAILDELHIHYIRTSFPWRGMRSTPRSTTSSAPGVFQP